MNRAGPLLTVVMMLATGSARGTTLLLDEFGAAPLDAAAWRFQSNSSGAFAQVSSGLLEIHSGTSNGGGGVVLSNDLFSLDIANALTLEVSARVSNADGMFVGLQDSSLRGFGFGVEEGTGTFVVGGVGLGGRQHFEVTGVTLTDWHTYRIEATSAYVDYFIDDMFVGRQTLFITAEHLAVTLDRVSRGQDETLFIDRVELTQSAVPEPGALALATASLLCGLARRRRSSRALA